MPLNRGQGQTTRWYQLCFVPTSPDSSDDSDIESVVLTPSTITSSTWQELSPTPTLPPPPPPPPPNPEPQIDWRLPPPPPPPDFVPSLMLHQWQHQPEWTGAWEYFNIEVQQHSHQAPSLSRAFEGDKSGCSMNARNGLGMVRLSDIDKLSNCPICMDEFKVCDQAYRLPCNHTYCSECILRWLNNSKTCPVCRLQLNGYSFDSINDNNGLDSQLDLLSLSPPAVVHNDLPRNWEHFFQSPPSLMPGIENSINDNDSLDSEPDNDGLDSEPETFLSPHPSPPLSVIHNDSPLHTEYFYESRPYLTPGIENSASGNSDVVHLDELGNSHEDGASHNASDTII
ncbi:unnamed protein product [Sphenostylis stenocarpa]|uniref:RING-type E3 ubiquitin transferase n=1 Tax=Sphenostylis stenocarpa TaxID=92480 RepID=A0AA86T063_9FABA|nr:unnamed protein product [Sphenostylis stenocarpa]